MVKQLLNWADTQVTRHHWQRSPTGHRNGTLHIVLCVINGGGTIRCLIANVSPPGMRSTRSKEDDVDDHDVDAPPQKDYMLVLFWQQDGLKTMFWQHDEESSKDGERHLPLWELLMSLSEVWGKGMHFSGPLMLFMLSDGVWWLSFMYILDSVL